jgi:serine/threonine-protein kinase
VKLIHPEALSSSDPGAAQRALGRFEREAQATAMLRSPHSVELFDYGIAANGTFYYVMELLDGIDLQSLVDDHGPQPPARVAAILRQSCHSLYEAHERGLLHRDIKPSNLFLCRYGMDVDFVKVLDFGLVKTSSAEEPGDAKLTMEKRVVGTPAFMAPEAVVGGEDLDARSDVYGLGCVAYWLLTGRLVFEQVSPTDMMRAHLKDDPIPITTHCPNVPEALERIVLQCLAKSADERPATARELDHMLGELNLDTQWTMERAERWWEEWECGMERRRS